MLGTSKSIWGFDPRSIPACSMWLDGADTATMTPSAPTSGTSITAWRDKSANAVSYAPGAVPTYTGCNIASPTYVTGGGINFNPSIPGGGTFTNNTTQGLTAVGGFPLNGTGFTAFAVAVATGTMTTYNSYFSYYTGGAEFIDFDAGGSSFCQITVDTTGLSINPPSTKLTTTRQIQTFQGSTTGSSFYVNGTLSNSSNYSYTQVNNPVATVVWIGNQAPGFRSFSGTIYELLLYNQSLSPTQRQSVEGYLAQKWSITLPTTHPFYGTLPFNRYFNPTDLPGCSLWLDGADNSSMNSTTAVTVWNDKSGLSRTMTGTGTWSNGAMVFNGSTNAFSNTTYVFPASNYSMFAVYSNTTSPGAATYMNVVYGSNGYPMLGIYDGGKLVSARSVVANTGALVPNVAASSNVLVSATYTPSTFSPFINGSNETTLAGTTLATTGLYVGGPSNYFNGSISELIIYASTLSAAQRQQVEGYLVQKWGLGSQTLSNHPYKLIPPAISQPPQFAEVTQGNWTRDWKPYLQSLVAANASGVTAALSNIPITPLKNWIGGVLAPNGNIYCAPYGASNVLVITPTTNALNYIGTVSTTSTYQGGVLAPNGKIYFTPTPSGTQGILVVDPIASTVSTFGSFSVAYSAGVLAPNGNIYCAPSGATNILVINPTTNTTSTVGSLTSSYYYGGVLGPNGKIYFMPQIGSNILVLDPQTSVTSNIAVVTTYSTGILAPNGKIYAVPIGAAGQSVMVLDPTTNGLSYFGTLTGTWYGAVLGPDGNIYCSPQGSSNVLVVNTTSNTVSYIGTVVTTQKYNGATMAATGNIYFTPTGSTSNVLEVVFSGLSQKPSSNYCMSAFANKL